MKQLDEAVDYVKKYKERFGCIPSVEKLDEYFYLFFDPMDKEQKEIFTYKLNLMGNYDASLEAAMKRNRKFASYDDFIEYCKMNGINNG